MRKKSNLNYMKVWHVVSQDVKEICKLTAINPEKDKADSDKRKHNLKTIKFLDKQKREISKFFESSVSPEDQKFCIQSLKSFDDFKERLILEDNKNDQSPFHLFLSGNLFLTSLYIYGCLNEKDENLRLENESILLKLLERDSRDKDRKNLDDIIFKELQSNKRLEDLNNQLSRKKSPKSIRNITKGLMPVFDPVKQLKGYKTSLERTLMGSKSVKFKDALTLDRISEYVSDWTYFPLLDVIHRARYSFLSSNPDSTIEFVLEDWKLILLTNSSNGAVKSRVLADDIRKYYYDERDYESDEDYSEEFEIDD